MSLPREPNPRPPRRAMPSSSGWTLALLQGWLRRTARQALEVSLGRQASEVLDQAFERYVARAHELPREASHDGRLLVHLAALTEELYLALCERGFAPDEARERTAEATWAVYRRAAAVPWWLARMAGERRRLRVVTNMYLKVPFGPPSYRVERLPSDENVVAFDVRRCPVADYFRARGLSELCVAAFCALDDPIAKRWGVGLERTKLLSRGDDRCDFRWRPGEAQGQRNG